MVIYYISIFVPIIGIYLEKKIDRNYDFLFYFLYSIALSIYIGFRDQIEVIGIPIHNYLLKYLILIFMKF